MARLSFDARETSLLPDIVDVCRKAYEWPVPFRLLDQLRDLLYADETSFLLQDTRLEYIPFHRGFDPASRGRRRDRAGGQDQSLLGDVLDQPRLLLSRPERRLRNGDSGR
jgi:hypothetical protein